MLIEAVLTIDADAVEILAQDEIHHARNRVRSVNRRCAAGHDVDALDRRRRPAIHADRLRRQHPLAVDEDEHTVRTEIAKIHIRRAVRPLLTLSNGRASLRDRGWHYG